MIEDLYTAIQYPHQGKAIVMSNRTLLELRIGLMIEHFESDGFWDYMDMTYEQFRKEPNTEDLILQMLKYDNRNAKLIKESLMMDDLVTIDEFISRLKYHSFHGGWRDYRKDDDIYTAEDCMIDIVNMEDYIERGEWNDDNDVYWRLGISCQDIIEDMKTNYRWFFGTEQEN